MKNSRMNFRKSGKNGIVIVLAMYMMLLVGCSGAMPDGDNEKTSRKIEQQEKHDDLEVLMEGAEELYKKAAENGKWDRFPYGP